MPYPRDGSADFAPSFYDVSFGIAYDVNSAGSSYDLCRRVIGPEPLTIDDRALPGCDLQSVAVGAVEKGCACETIAALEAEAARGSR